jgi:TonB family protein
MEIQQTPEFPGGENAKMQFFSENIRYPVIAAEQGIQGRIVAQFDVQNTGKIANVEITSGTDPSLDREVMRVIQAMPDWTPGERSVRQTFSVLFRLQGDGFESFTADEPTDLVVTAFAPAARRDAAQQNTLRVSGRVIDLQGAAIAGATISIQGTTTGTVTDMNGNFSLNITPNSTLIASYVGISAAFNVQEESTIEIMLSANNTRVQIDRTAERHRTVISIEENDVDNELINRATEGRIAAITLDNVRGIITGSGEPLSLIHPRPPRPLFVVNDKIKDADFDLSGISPDEIESISVLRDEETATRLHGERGKNGVILITLKN